MCSCRSGPMGLRLHRLICVRLVIYSYSTGKKEVSDDIAKKKKKKNVQ